MTATDVSQVQPIDSSKGGFGWLTPGVCQAIFAALVLLHFLSGWHFLHHVPPELDLSGDEAQYWTWSRQLALSYYSKGPLVAYVIRASCDVFGQTMPAVRFPALLLAVGTSICAFWLTRKLFKSHRLALGVYLLGALVPMYTVGSLLMTIDPLLYFFWALACCFIVKALFDQSRWAWVAAGVAIGVGFLAKYNSPLWLVGVLLFMAVDAPSRRWLKTPWPWVMVVVSLVFTTPVIVWNAQHHWVSLHHVATQTGANHTGGFGRGNLLAFLAAQLGLINPFIAVCMIAAVIHSIRKLGPFSRQCRLLLYIGGFYFVVCMLDAFRSKVEANWPAPAYFTLLVLTGQFIATRLTSKITWRPWRFWVYGAVIFGIAVQPILSDATELYPLVTWVNKSFPRNGKPRLSPKNVDFAYKLRGVAEQGKRVGEELAKLPPGSFVMCEDYQDGSQMQFYVPGQPKTYFAGSYWSDPVVRRRLSQFDMWPGRNLAQPKLKGRDCIYLGTMAYAPLRESFDHVEHLPDFQVIRRGLVVRTVQLWRCIGFHGMKRPAGAESF